MSAVFISYVHEDAKAVTHLASVLEQNGVKVWLDRNNLMPGMRWEQAIKSAIADGAFFLSIYSRNRQTREQGYVNEELVLAIDQIRRRPANKTWFIPVKLDDCEVEDRSIGAGESILSLQLCDLTAGKPAFEGLLRTLGVSEPVTDLGTPLAPGIPSFVKILAGYIKYDNMPGIPDSWGSINFPISGGWCARQEDESILAYIETTAPFEQLQIVNESLGLSAFHAISSDRVLSSDTNGLTRFSYEREYVLPKGINVPDFQSGETKAIPLDVGLISRFDANGALDGNYFTGTFDASLTFITPSGNQFQPLQGAFQIKFEAE